LNESGNIVEGISSNIFLIKGDSISTPPLKDGPVAGIMRKKILKIADSNGLKIEFENSLNETHLLQADEVFFTNSISGIKWILAYKDRRYFNNLAHQFVDKLNMLAFKNEFR
jgi:branched-chain amino acid aminotransferase